MTDLVLNLEPNNLIGILELRPEDLERIIELNGLYELRDKYLSLNQPQDSYEFSYIDKLLNFKEEDYPQLFETVDVAGIQLPKVVIFGLLSSFYALKQAYIAQADIKASGIKKDLRDLKLKDFIFLIFFLEFEINLSRHFARLANFIGNSIIKSTGYFISSFDNKQISQDNLREKYFKLLSQKERLLHLFKLEDKTVADIEENLSYMQYRIDKKAEEIIVPEKPKPSHVISVGNETLEIDSKLEKVLDKFNLSGKPRKQIKILLETVFNHLDVVKKEKDPGEAFIKLFNSIPKANWLIKSKLTEGNGFKLSGTILPKLELIVTFNRVNDQIVINFSMAGLEA